MKNTGKLFEDDFKRSVPEYCFCYRLKDTTQAYNNSKKTKFTWNNPCDFFIYNSIDHRLYSLELKTTKSDRMNWQKSIDDNNVRNIKYHQISSLNKMNYYDGIVSGFIFNFRNDTIGKQRSYFQDIYDFNNMIGEIDKKSFNEIDLVEHRSIKIFGEKKRTRYKWNLSKMMQDIPRKVCLYES